MAIRIRDLKDLDGTWDVYGNVADEIAVAFDNDGTEILTEEGYKEFADILDVPIKIRSDWISVDTESLMTPEDHKNEDYTFDGYDSYPPKIQRVSMFFWALAGYIDSELYDKWFINRYNI